MRRRKEMTGEESHHSMVLQKKNVRCRNSRRMLSCALVATNFLLLFVPSFAAFLSVGLVRMPHSRWVSGPSLMFMSTPEGKEQDGLTNQSPDEETETLKANRFHKLAPDANLAADDFREQLKENMKKDLEERRKRDPNRGNQPTRSYLDGL